SAHTACYALSLHDALPILGVPLGVLLYLSGKGRLAANPMLNAVLSFVVNVLRSVPFIILLIVMLPVTVLLVGTSLGVAGAIPPRSEEHTSELQSRENLVCR